MISGECRGYGRLEFKFRQRRDRGGKFTKCTSHMNDYDVRLKRNGPRVLSTSDAGVCSTRHVTGIRSYN